MRIYKPNAVDFKDGPEVEFKLENRAVAHDVAGQVDIAFDEPGVWWIQILLDDQPVLSYPLPVWP